MNGRNPVKEEMFPNRIATGITQLLKWRHPDLQVDGPDGGVSQYSVYLLTVEVGQADTVGQTQLHTLLHLSPRVQVVHFAQHDVPFRVCGHQVRIFLQYNMADPIIISSFAFGIEKTQEKQSCLGAK
jgi:hypothetical protein